MWWATTYGWITVSITLIALAVSVWIAWAGREDLTYNAIPRVLKTLTVSSAALVVLTEVVAIGFAANGIETVTVRYQPFWPQDGYTVGDTVPDEIRIESGEYSLATMKTTYLIDIAKFWAIIQHSALIALAVVVGVVVWRFADALRNQNFRDTVTSAFLLRSGLAAIVFGLLWQGAAQTFQITVGRMLHIQWMAGLEGKAWPAMLQPEFLRNLGWYEPIVWPFTDIQLWPFFVGMVLLVVAAVVRKSERDENELRGLI